MPNEYIDIKLLTNFAWISKLEHRCIIQEILMTNKEKNNEQGEKVRHKKNADDLVTSEFIIKKKPCPTKLASYER